MFNKSVLNQRYFLFIALPLAIAVVFVPRMSSAISDGELGIGVAYDNQVHPENFVYELRPGETFQDDLLISHTGTQTAHVKLYTEDKNESGDSDSGIGSNRSQFLSQWIKFEKESFDFPPDGTQVSRFTVTIPPDAKKQDYRGSIYIHEPPGENDPLVRVSDGHGGTVMTRVGRKVGVGVYLKVTDDPHMPLRTKKNISLRADSIKTLILSIVSITILLSILLIVQEKRKITLS